MQCLFCNQIVVQGKECSQCEANICTPCLQKWNQAETAKFFQRPCKCSGAGELKSLNKLKQNALTQIRFKCNNLRCDYALTYDELLLGTHELDECKFMQVICEGCGIRIIKQQQIRHESVECDNPLGKCGFCKRVFSLQDMIAHMRDCNQRQVVKIEYGLPAKSDYNHIEDKELRPESLYDPKTALSRKRVKAMPCEYCQEKITGNWEQHKCYKIEQMVKKKVSRRELKSEVKTEITHKACAVQKELGTQEPTTNLPALKQK